ncbi:hypothetical protein [Marinifilum sp.]|uniref:hypothetical protein n=1 Tax=Marinifilum sp. TaxID=2033137 RepID=UPI003BA9E48E
MKILKYILSIILVLWGLLIAYSKLFSIGLDFPFLTILTILAIVMGIIKSVKSGIIFFITACLWIIFSAETIGFIILFDPSNYEKMLIGLIPFVLGAGLLFSVKIESKFINKLYKKLILIAVLLILGIGSYIYKPTIEEINCWYYFDNDETYNVRFTKSPERTFDVELTSVDLKKEVMAEAIQYEGHVGYYCPETKIRVVSSFGKIKSIKIIGFRNSETDEKINFTSTEIIPLESVNGKLEIIKPFMLRLWN